MRSLRTGRGTPKVPARRGTQDARQASMSATSVVHKCTLRFRNGKSVTGSVQSRDTAPVSYEGAVERLPYRIELADPLLLRVLFRSFARELSARFEEEEIGSPALNLEEVTEIETGPSRRERFSEAA